MMVSLQGFDIEMATECAKRMGLEIKAPAC